MAWSSLLQAKLQAQQLTTRRGNKLPNLSAGVLVLLGIGCACVALVCVSYSPKQHGQHISDTMSEYSGTSTHRSTAAGTSLYEFPGPRVVRGLSAASAGSSPANLGAHGAHGMSR